MMTIICLVNIHHFLQIQKRKRNILFLRWEFLATFITTYSSVDYISHAVHYIPVLMYLITGSLYLLTAFIQFPLPPSSVQFSSVQFSYSVVSDSLRPHELQHARPPCPSPSPRVHSDSRPSSQWCHPAISSSVIPFSSCPQSSQHQSLFQWVNSSHQAAKVLEFQLQHQPFQWTPRTDLL